MRVGLLSAEGGEKERQRGKAEGTNVSESVVSHFSHLSFPVFCYFIGCTSAGDVTFKCAESRNRLR